MLHSSELNWHGSSMADTSMTFDFFNQTTDAEKAPRGTCNKVCMCLTSIQFLILISEYLQAWQGWQRTQSHSSS